MNRLVKSLNNIVASANVSRTRPTKIGKNKRPKRRVSRPQRTRALPAAYGTHVQPRFSILSRTANTCTVSGCDLVYPIPEQLLSNGDILFSIIPANPAYWLGTKISQMAPAYMNYRPINFRVSYIPQVAVTQQGTVFMGTFWNGAAPADNLQQSLFTSNGGMLTQCYIPADTTVRLGSNLQQRLFTMNDSLHPDTSPFIFLAGVRGASVVPGYFYVTYTYEFRNPVGSAWLYYRSEPMPINRLPNVPKYHNMSLILVSDSSTEFGPGTILDYESDGSIHYHGSLINLPDTAVVQLYANEQSSITNRIAKDALLYNAIRTQNNTIVPLSLFIPASPASSITIPAGESIVAIQYSNNNSSASQVMFQVGNDSASSTFTMPGTSGYYYFYYTLSSNRTNPVYFVTVDGHNGPGIADSAQSGASAFWMPCGSLVGLRV